MRRCTEYFKNRCDNERDSTGKVWITKINDSHLPAKVRMAVTCQRGNPSVKYGITDVDFLQLKDWRKEKCNYQKPYMYMELEC